jgi:hypothetical protein
MGGGAPEIGLAEDGYIVRVTTLRPGRGEPVVIDYIVAERDADRAVDIVKQRAAPNGEVEPVRLVSTEVVLRYRLNRGQCTVWSG